MTITARTDTAPASLAAADEPEADAAVVLAGYARQVDELACLVEDWQAANTGYAQVLTHALGELHVVLDETATGMNREAGRR
ncbi:MAG: hypothetical protein DLM59_15900 [Pseudonocardiales bacterium]|nr:MAG: hypothetical protein DLM59_15900 [Pseudonocardiales bacterium]